ncbi:hypothetical protein, conserved [Eimeria praecox]|uniref:Uncharacterized protein n=1 Tax=Eimeria praecox TaxID=51316 RepID=U6H7A7_9EIME|nr:hypothetical protein, conserved [Eimeria praecox]
MLRSRGNLHQGVPISATPSAAPFSSAYLRGILQCGSTVSVQLRSEIATPLHYTCPCRTANNAFVGLYALQKQKEARFLQAQAVKHFWQQAAAAAAAAAAARERELQDQQQQPQKQHRGAGKCKRVKADAPSAAREAATAPVTAAAATATAAAKVLADPRALDGVYSSSFYLSFVAAAAAHAISPAATAATEAGAPIAGPARLRGANKKRQAAIERLLRLKPHMLPSVARVAAAAARMQPRDCTSTAAGQPAGVQALWRVELATVLCSTSAAAAAAADRAFWNAFAVATTDAAEALAPADVCSIATAAAASATAGSPGWKGLNERHQRMLSALQEQIRKHAQGYSLCQLLSSLEALQSLQRIPSAARPAATAAVSTAATAARAANAAFGAVGGDPGVKKKKASIAAAAAATGDLPLLNGWFSTGQLVELAELLVQLQPHAKPPSDNVALHALNSRLIAEAVASEVSLQQLLRLIRAYGGMGLTSPSLLAAALSYFKGAGNTERHLVEAPGLCTIPPERAQAAALRAITAPAAGPDTWKQRELQQQQQEKLLLPCTTAYTQCLADAETSAAAATAATAAFPVGTSSKDQTALMLLHCLLEQQAVGRPELLHLLPTLLQELQHQQKHQQYLQCCGLVLSVCASCGVQLLHVWEDLLSPLLQPPSPATPAAVAQEAAAAGTPWGGWLLSRPLLQHVEAAISAACFCGMAYAGAETAGEKHELLSASASAAAHAAATAGGFLSFLHRCTCIGAETAGEKHELLSAAASAAAHAAATAGGFLSFLHRCTCSSSCLRQLTGASLEEIASDVCGLFRVQSAAAVLLHLLPQQHSPQQQQGELQGRQQLQQQRQQQQSSEGCTGASLAVAEKEPSPSVRELLAAVFPEWQQLQQQQHKVNEQQSEEAHLQQQLQRQQQLLLQQRSGLVFELLLEIACRGSPKGSDQLPPTLLVLMDGPTGEAAIDPNSPSIHPAVLCFLQSAARGAAGLRSNSDSNGKVDAISSSSGNNNSTKNSPPQSCSAFAAGIAPTRSSCGSSSSSEGAIHVDSLLLLPQLLHNGQGDSSVLQQLLQLLLLLPDAEGSMRLSAVTNRFMQHLERMLLADRLQQRLKGAKPRTLNAKSES